jgi:hypothetical protein
MYLAMIILLMGVLPVASIAIEFAALHGEAGLLSLIGKWFVFWPVGVRLILAGLRQVADPTFTAATIFGVKDQAALTIVQELGFGNLSIGTLGALSLIYREWIIPAALAGGLFYGLAGTKHALRNDRNAIENIATVSDLFIFAVLAGYLAAALFGVD